MIAWNDIDRDIGAATSAAFSTTRRSAAAGGSGENLAFSLFVYRPNE
jgi:hypothetical protein